MGRKLIGLTVGFLLTIVLTFYLISPEYDAIVRWLAPYLGPWLRFALMFLILIFGDSFTFLSLLIVWAVTGIAAGLLTRSYWGAIPVAICIFLLTFLMLVVGFVGMLIPLFTGGGPGIDFMAFFAAIPSDVSVLDILSAPVIGPIIQMLIGGFGDLFGGGGGGSMGLEAILGSIQGIIGYIILQAVKNFVTLLVCTIIGGGIGRLIKKP
jgi:hypothetical protein